MNKLFSEKSQCTGCHSCMNMCPAQAITMVQDSEGFLYPKIDEDKCTNCNLCRKVCPIHQRLSITEELPSAFAAVCKSEELRMGSSSGGIFPLLAEYILRQGGVVFGAVSTDDNKAVKHCAATTIQENKPQRGSKYLQSYIGDSFQQAERFLKQGKIVLFTGTPCQISGLQLYLRKNYENLYTQDLICHGAPSPAVWKKFVTEMEKQKKASVKEVHFRRKERGWRNYSLELLFSNGHRYSQGLYQDPYLRGFMSDLFLRPSCYQCRNKSISRQADITLADYWGVDTVHPELDDDKGVSLVYVHSEKGKQLLEAIREDVVLIPTDAVRAAQSNPAMTRSAKCPSKRDRFWQQFSKRTYKKLSQQFWEPSAATKFARQLKRFVKRIIRKA